MTFHVFEPTDVLSADVSSANASSAAARVLAPDGSVASDAASATVEVRREGDQVDVQVQGASASWSVLLHGVSDRTSAGVASVERGTAQAERLGTRLVPAEGVKRLVVHL